MINLEMKLCGDLVLREKCAPVENITPEILAALDEMVVMMEDQKGVGLAAPQVGILQRFIVIKNPNNEKIYKMINPIIVSKSSSTVMREEGCLSVLGNDDLPVYANVERPESVVVEWTDETGTAQHEKMTGYKSRIVQHEVDHLEGVLFMDYLSPVRREMLMRKVKKRKA